MEKTENNMFEKIFEGIEKQSENNIKAHEGDYVVDGLLYCHKCNTPKQCRVVIPGLGEKTPFCLCKCETEKRDAEEAEFKKRQLQQRIQELRKMGFPESEMSEWTFAKDDQENPKITQVALNFVEHFEEMKKMGKGLLLYGDVGTGKTFHASCIANALIDKGYPCLVTDFARLVNTISGMYDGKQEYIDGLNRFQLLVIDDLAAERDTEYMNEIVQNIINCRYRAGLPTIITTNLTTQELKNPTDLRKQRTYSRVLEMCVPVKVEGVDRRREKSKEDYFDLKTMLGL